MDLDLPEDIRHIQEAARRFARHEIAPIAERMDRDDHFPRDLFQRMGEHGFLGPTISPVYDGLGLDYLAQAVILEEIARASPALALSVGAHSNLCLDNLARNGTDEQKARYLPALVRGEAIGALALTEPNARVGRDRGSRRGPNVREPTTSSPGPSSSSPTGRSRTRSSSMPRPPPSAAPGGHTAFIVPKGTPGLSVARKLDKMGMRGSPTAELALQAVRWRGVRRFGREHGGVAVMMSGLNVERAVLAAIPVGIIGECLEAVRAYARERHQFGSRSASSS